MDFSKLDLSGLSSLSQRLSESIQPISSKINYGSMMNMEKNSDGYLVEYEDITSKEFLERLYSSGKVYHLGNPEKVTRVTGVVEIEQKKFNKEYGIIDNYEFEHSFIIMGESEEKLFSLGESIVFLNCRFEKKLQIQNSKFERGETALGSFEPNSIEILGGFLNEISIIKCELYGILFSKFESEPLKINHIDIKNCEFQNGSISLDNTDINGMCDINFNNFNHGSLRFVNNKIFGGCRFSVNKNLSLQFYGKESVFEKPVFIYHGDYKSIEFNDIHFNEEVTLIACSIEEEIKLIGNTFEDRLWILSKDDTNDSISSVAPKEIWIQNNKFQNGFKYDSEKNTVDNLVAIFSEKSSGVIEFEDVIFNHIELVGSNFNNSVFFRDCLYFHLKISNFFNKALVSFNNNCPNNTNAFFEELKIENSNLGNTEFYDFDFRVYNIIRIIDSRLDNIFVNGVVWFEPHQLQVDEGESDSKKILSQKREIYRQLKLAAEKQSDRITSLKFKAIELEIHNELLGKDKFFSKKWFQQIGDVAAIWAGSTNNHGQNWILPLGLAVLITTIPFYPLIFMAADTEISLWCPDCDFISLKTFGKKFWDYGSVWPSLFNPARRMNDLFSGVEVSFALGFWDGLHRIFLAFFIFQVVSAFRKFVK